MSERRVCGVIGQPRATQRYQATEPDDEVGLTATIIDYASGMVDTAIVVSWRCCGMTAG